MYLRAWNTQEVIAEEFELTHQAISKIIESFAKNAKIGKIIKREIKDNESIESIWQFL